jgi:CIC family chloride channel protein
LLLFEMTNDYRIILPLMLTVVVSLLISQLLQRDSVYALGLARHGVRLDRGRDIDVLQHIRVEEVMEPEAPTLQESDNLAMATQLLAQQHRHGMAVVDRMGRLVGVLTLQDIDREHGGEPDKISAGQACTRDLVTAFADETLGQVLRRMSTRELGHIPVVSRDDPNRLVGWLRRVEVIRAYDIALTRRAVLRHQAQRVRLGAQLGEDVFMSEVVVKPGSPCDGHMLKDVACPSNSVVATLRRGRHLSAPNGHTTLRAGDVLLVVMEADDQEAWQNLCQPQS